MKRKFFVSLGAGALAAVVAFNVSINSRSEVLLDLALKNTEVLATPENDNKDDEMNAPSAVICLDGRRIECTMCMKGRTDCSPTCSADLCK